MRLIFKVILAVFLSANIASANEVITLKTDLLFQKCIRNQDNTLNCSTPDAALKEVQIKLISTGPGSPAMGSVELHATQGLFDYEASIFIKKRTDKANAPYELSIWFASMYDRDQSTYRLTVLGGATITDFTNFNEMFFNAEDLEDKGIIYSPTLLIGASK